MSVATLIKFKDEREARGIPVTPDLKKFIKELARTESDAAWYKKQNWLGKWWHRRHCLERHS